MPTYQYRCKKCQFEFEERQSITADALTDCTQCDGKVERVITGGSGFIFKGQGFYTTDYRTSNYKKEAAKDSGKEKPKTDKKSETKPKSTEKKSTKSESSPKSTRK